MLVSKIFGFLRFWGVLEGLERSWRLIGRVSSYFPRNPTWWYRVMTNKPYSGWFISPFNGLIREWIGLIGVKTRFLMFVFKSYVLFSHFFRFLIVFPKSFPFPIVVSLPQTMAKNLVKNMGVSYICPSRGNYRNKERQFLGKKQINRKNCKNNKLIVFCWPF